MARKVRPQSPEVPATRSRGGPKPKTADDQPRHGPGKKPKGTAAASKVREHRHGKRRKAADRESAARMAEERAGTRAAKPKKPRAKPSTERATRRRASTLVGRVRRVTPPAPPEAQVARPAPDAPVSPGEVVSAWDARPTRRRPGVKPRGR